MDDFFSKYGWVVAVGVIVSIVIAMMTPVGSAIQTQVVSFVNDFASKVSSFVPTL